MSQSDLFQAALEKLADNTATAARKITNRRNITKADKVIRLAALFNRANATATALGDVFTSRQLEELTGHPTPTKGIPATDDSARLLKSATTALEDREAALERVERLARSEPLQSAQRAATEAMSNHFGKRGGYIGWTRQLNTGACEVCQRWERDGRVWPPDHRMPQHPNCACVQRIVITTTKPKSVRRKKHI
ncbi:hypothetical protein [Mycolicibacterium mengxianglii]|uniref:hypothetical protein n=1 Tax=Mycolicibacterium mengxianglii TaxID=2736649 RepID=UPI0018EF0891|nr:hypothetical protein [Mycolicibacterium mengxianglii]